MTPGANEVLMVNHEEQFTEGLSSNFFVVKEGQLYTAPDGMVRDDSLVWPLSHCYQCCCLINWFLDIGL
jgi:hypothetical protein